MEIADHRQPTHSIDPLFYERWSPRAFTDEPIPDAVLLACFEAARWAPSSMNAQPWRLVYARRGAPEWSGFTDALFERSRGWAQHAAALVAFVADTRLDISGRLVESPTHAFDAGAAAQNFSLQAIRLGWHAHGMASFDGDLLRQTLRIPERFKPYAMFAIGRRGDPQTLSPELSGREFPSDRRPLADTIMEGSWRD